MRITIHIAISEIPTNTDEKIMFHLLRRSDSRMTPEIFSDRFLRTAIAKWVRRSLIRVFSSASREICPRGTSFPLQS
ncbi:MAG: hypothetical protein HC887_08865 [Desulfobacteraceae bacterium]|nr:hypothetical protein [Desulfobacteraceae bacterium]